MCEGGRRGVISPNKFKKKRINQFSEKINKNILGPNFFDLKLTWPKLFSNRAYPETCVSSELLRACFVRPKSSSCRNLKFGITRLLLLIPSFCCWTSWLPYSIYVYFHDFEFVFVTEQIWRGYSRVICYSWACCFLYLVLISDVLCWRRCHCCSCWHWLSWMPRWLGFSISRPVVAPS